MKKLLFTFLFFTSLSQLNAQCDVKVREAFGGISAIALYNTHATINTLSDCLNAKVYTPQKIKESLTEQVNFAESIITMLTACQASTTNGLTPEDKVYVKDMITCLNLLKEEARALMIYAEKNTLPTKDKYTAAKNAAWKKVAVLLDLEQ